MISRYQMLSNVVILNIVKNLLSSTTINDLASLEMFRSAQYDKATFYYTPKVDYSDKITDDFGGKEKFI